MFDLTEEPATCPGCHQPCAAVRFGKALRYLCDPCSDAEKAARRAASRRAECMAIWAEVVPTEFQVMIERDRLHPALLPALDLDGLQGVGMIGASHSGKTRVACALLRKASQAGKACYVTTASLYRQAAADRHTRDTETSGRALERLRSARNAPVLLLDDVGKGARSESGDEALYELLTHRRDNGLVTHWTANGNGKWIAARYGEDRGPAIAVRLANLAGCTGRGTGRIFTAAEITP